MDKFSYIFENSKTKKGCLLQNLRVLAMGTAERISLKIQFEHLIAAIAMNCPQLERLEFR